MLAFPFMAAETPVITDSNQPYDGDLHTELHEILRLVRKLDRELEPLRPLLAQFTGSPVAAAAAIRRSRKAIRGHE